MFTHVMIGSNDLEQARDFYDATFSEYTIQSEAAGIKGTSFLCRGASEPFAIRDGRLITGQQQYSSALTSELVMEALDEY